jgi:hypothetical protein
LLKTVKPKQYSAKTYEKNILDFKEHCFYTLDQDNGNKSSSPYSTYKINLNTEFNSEDNTETTHNDNYKKLNYSRSRPPNIDLNKLTGSGIESIKIKEIENGLNNEANFIAKMHSKTTDFQLELNDRLRSINDLASENLLKDGSIGDIYYNEIDNRSENVYNIPQSDNFSAARTKSKFDVIGSNTIKTELRSSGSSTISSISKFDLKVKEENLLKNTPDSNYSLIKTTINNKPPILKPKPRNNVYYSSKSLKSNKQFNQASSPCTSVTDVSSSNTATPQHLPIQKSTEHKIGKNIQNKPENFKISTTFGSSSFNNDQKNYDNISNLNFKKCFTANLSNTIERRNQHVKNSEC